MKNLQFRLLGILFLSGAVIFLGCGGMYGAGGRQGGGQGLAPGPGNPSSSQQCTMDVECGVGKKCVSGVCTGGITPQITGRCVTGSFGKRVCSNNGNSCWVNTDCM